MFGWVLKRIFGSQNDRILKTLEPIVVEVAGLESSVLELSDSQLKDKTTEFRKRLKEGTALDEILPEAFAVVRECSKRRLGMRHFDSQILGGVVLHQGKISEMKTGEGKTLVATLPLYLNALTGHGSHLVTVNDYLAKRDAQWMGMVYHSLGLSVGIIQHEAAYQFDPEYESLDRRLEFLRAIPKQEAYRCDITYGTNNEYGFDYLRDNMTVDLSQCAQRKLHYAIVDEVDSILIDEARTPLIISGPTEENTDKYYRINQIIPSLKKEADYVVEEKTKTVTLTEDGNIRVEKLLGVSNLYDIVNIDLVHHVIQGLKAHALFERDVDYVVQGGEVIIVDEFTGRMMPGRRWSDGLHQAVEAKEGVKIANENQTLASITFQNYFRLYKKLAGMTGTADTEAAEFARIYNLDVVVIPPNRPMIRKDYADVVYRTEDEKFNAISEEIAELSQNGQPVLVGTISIEKSERLSGLLKRKGIKHSVLNAKFHEREAEIIAQAGSKGTVTIATNMAGRGTDILLGGNPEFLSKQHEIQNPKMSETEKKSLTEKIRKECEANKKEVIESGGLHILGTERHESRRIDNQLRGRSGRQGDPGSSHFYLSLEDDLMRIFGSEKISGLMQRLGMEEGVPIEHRMVSRAILNAQKKVEDHNFDIRKQLIEYDDVMNKQREVIYEQRRQILRGEDLTDLYMGMIEDRLTGFLDLYCSEEVYPEEWDLAGLGEAFHRQFGISVEMGEDLREVGREALREDFTKKIDEHYQARAGEMGEDLMEKVQKMVILRVIDAQWKDHLLGMDTMKEGIGLRGYGQKDPLVEYKREGFSMFSAMMERVKADTVEQLFKVQLVEGSGTEAGRHAAPQSQRFQFSHGTVPPKPKTIQRNAEKVGRNDPCPCGSGKKFKKCHGR